jgi:hypothetical protein
MGNNGPCEARTHQETYSGDSSLGATLHICYKKWDRPVSNIGEIAKPQAWKFEVRAIAPTFATQHMLMFLDWSEMPPNSSKVQERKQC